MPERVRAVVDRMLDATVALSFDRSGFERHARSFAADDLDVDLAGRHCAVTGANSGIGLATARALAGLGATVSLLCRNPARGQAALDALVAETGSSSLALVVVDLSDQASIRQAVAAWAPERIDVLVHNAGVLPDRHSLGADGLELTLATNLVGPFVLTAELLPALRRAPQPRLIQVSSGGMYTQRLDVDALDAGVEGFDGVVAYARTKRAQVVLGERWAQALGPAVAVHTMHPGWADTPGVQRSLPGFHRVTERLLRSPEQGADTVIWLAASAAAATGDGGFWFDRSRRRTHLLPGTRGSPAERARLWTQLHAWGAVDPEIWRGA